ncbi:hypothetical protein ACFWA5_48400, partial [Streptomyces mirabilis]|uniref:hypothetical protein n=1 Tax=Streptomyces mirabilis TaxID=68239 RepID=UPI003658582C
TRTPAGRPAGVRVSAELLAHAACRTGGGPEEAAGAGEYVTTDVTDAQRRADVRRTPSGGSSSWRGAGGFRGAG